MRRRDRHATLARVRPKNSGFNISQTAQAAWPEIPFLAHMHLGRAVTRAPPPCLGTRGAESAAILLLISAPEFNRAYPNRSRLTEGGCHEEGWHGRALASIY